MAQEQKLVHGNRIAWSRPDGESGTLAPRCRQDAVAWQTCYAGWCDYPEEQPMAIVTVMYPETEGARFDLDYYMKTHMPLLAAHGADLGLQGYWVVRGVGTPGGGKPAYRIIATLAVDSLEKFGKGMHAHGKEIMGDIPNFTDIQPVIQFSERVE
jgi:uncharacterized protein (TIGR02118 family)